MAGSKRGTEVEVVGAESHAVDAGGFHIGGAARAWAGVAVGKYGILLVFAAVVLGFSLVSPDIYPTVANAQAIASTQSIIALLALAAMTPLIVGHIDLSVGFQMGLSQSLCAGLIIRQGVSWELAILIVLAIGVLIGVVNALLVTRLRLDSFISTLGVGILLEGFSSLYTHNESIGGALPSAFTSLGRDRFVEIPLPFIYVIAVAGILWVVLEYTAIGRESFATGGNPRAAALAGVRTERATIGAFVIAGVISAGAGALSVTQVGGSSPVVGVGLLLPAFAAAFLGSTSIRPGRFNAIGTVLAVFLLAAGITGLQQLGAASYVEQFFYGGALLVAVTLARWAHAKRT